jgi:twinkle protein
MSKNIIRASEIVDEMLHGFKNGKERGSTTHIPRVDGAWTWRKTDLNIWTGYQNAGKSLFMEQLMTLKSYFEGWKHALFTPENIPATDFFDNIIEMLVGKSCDPYYANNLMTEAEYRAGIEFVNEHFYLVYPEGEWSLDNVLECFDEIITEVDTVTIDPYNKIHHNLAGERGDVYVSNFMSKCKRYAIDKKVAFNLVAHQLTARKEENGRYVKPDLNYIKGGGAFADAADNVLYVWRPERAIDFSSTEVMFGSQKIKKQKLVGIPSDITNINFRRKENRYTFDGVAAMKNVTVNLDTQSSLENNTNFDNEMPF